jgi:hypothetical protein
MASGCSSAASPHLILHLAFDEQDRNEAPEYFDRVSGQYVAIGSGTLNDFVFMTTTSAKGLLHVPSSAPIEDVDDDYVSCVQFGLVI